MVSLAPIRRVVFCAALSLLLGQPIFQTALADTPRFLGQKARSPHPPDAGWFLDSPTRLRIDLNGEWDYSIRGKDRGTVILPSAFDFVDKVEYQRFFALTTDQLDHYRFHFVAYGSNYATDVTLNGEYLLHHEGGYTSFIQPLPSVCLHPGDQNFIQVVVNNALDAKSSLPVRQLVWGWRNYGGLFRDVYLLATPLIYLRDGSYTVSLSDDNKNARIVARANIDGDLRGASSAVPRPSSSLFGVTCELVDRLSGEVVARSAVTSVTPSEQGLTPVSNELTVVNPQLWSPETPSLYMLKWSLTQTKPSGDTLLDDYRTICGIRQLASRRGDFVLNGKRLVLKGVIWYEDHPTWGSAIPFEDLERDVVLMKNLGANVVRFANHPPHPYMLDLCDRYGLLAMVEMPLISVPSGVLLAEPYRDLVHSTLREMIGRDRTHPSVMAWGLGSNLATSDTALRPFVESLVGSAHGMDDRMTYLATHLFANDTCSDLVDIAALELSATDQKLFRHDLEQWRARHNDRPVILARFGSEVDHANRSGYNNWLSQQAQARYFLQRLEIARVLDYDGAIIGSFNDWMGDRPALTVHVNNPWYHSMGLVSAAREKRIAYDAVRSVFRGEKIAALPAGTSSGGAPIVYVLAGFIVLVATAYVYNASRRFREHLNRSVLSAYNFFADVRDQVQVPFWHTTLLGIVISVAVAMVLSSVFYHFRNSVFLDNVLSTILFTDSVKAVVVRLIWDPLRFILVGTPLVFLVQVLLAGGIHMLRLPLKRRIYAIHAYAVAVWSAAPLLAFIPIGMILYRVMEGQGYVIPSLALVGLFFVWVFLRVVKGVAIMYDIYPPKAYALALVGVLAVAGVLYLYYDLVHGLPAYIEFLYSIR
jgi:hypothetical protein